MRTPEYYQARVKEARDLLDAPEIKFEILHEAPQSERLKYTLTTPSQVYAHDESVILGGRFVLRQGVPTIKLYGNEHSYVIRHEATHGFHNLGNPHMTNLVRALEKREEEYIMTDCDDPSYPVIVNSLIESGCVRMLAGEALAYGVHQFFETGPDLFVNLYAEDAEAPQEIAPPINFFTLEQELGDHLRQGTEADFSKHVHQVAYRLGQRIGLFSSYDLSEVDIREKTREAQGHRVKCYFPRLAESEAVDKLQRWFRMNPTDLANEVADTNNKLENLLRESI